MRNKHGKFNLLAQLISDNSHIPIRVSLFSGDNKASKLLSVKEFRNTCLLLSLDKVLEYGDVISLVQADEKNRKMMRNDVPLFNQNAYREAIINAFVHNLWVDGNAPMITIYNNRLEVLSHGSLPKKQTKEGFFSGVSIPVNQKLSDIFLQLHISERSGRGVPTIVNIYGKKAFDFRENSIVVTIPFNRINNINVGDKVGDKATHKVTHKATHNVTKKLGDGVVLNKTRNRILEEMKKNPQITRKELGESLDLKKTAIQNNISYLRNNGYIKRVGSNRTGYWEVNDI
ncbi:MAG: ATP-binding protein [Bdellovibrionota bacterium]